MSQLFTSGSQSIWASISTSVLPMNIQYWFPLGLNDSFAVWETLTSLLQHHSSKASILSHSAFFMVQLSHHMTTGKIIALTIQNFIGKVMSLFFNTLSKFVIAFHPRSKCLIISWLQSPSAVILEPEKIKFSRFPLFPHLFAMTAVTDSTFLMATKMALTYRHLRKQIIGQSILNQKYRWTISKSTAWII